jgi:diguanylate cyclase (GGDEF)-like protein
VLVIVTCDDRDWTPEELAALELIASLLAQIQARTGAEERLRYLAEHDELTGLCNRRALITHLDDRLSAGKGGPVSALFFDMDRLKTINDYMGHIAGDSFIRLLAQRLQRALDGDAFVARLGGDEFVVVPAAPMDADTAESLAYRLQSTITESVDIDGEMLSRTASIGVALGIPGRDSTSDLLNRADRAVIMAKRAGGNQVALVSSDTTLNSELRNDVELHLRDAIAGNSLVLHYLPEIDMRNGKILATEALVRWQHPTRGLLPPGSFIEVAESINLAGELGRWVIRRACADFSKWQTQAVGKGIILRVNVSPVQLVTHGFVDDVLDTIDEFGLDRESVCLEITESAVVKDLETTLRTLVSLREVGLRIAIDDFGTGYSVLSGLKMLPVDTLKIDKGFVFELGSNASDLAIVQAIIALANAFGLQVVAEGVETEAAATILLQHGCHRAQGFMLWPPVTAEAMASLLVRGRIPVRFSRNPYN